jgi:hypothetical protein
MPQIFHPAFNTISRVTILAAVFLLAILGWVGWVAYGSSYVTVADIAHLQPVPFSHEHHAGRLAIDCRYCHTSVEDSSFAGIPPTKTCMNCHSQMWVGSEMLAPVRASYANGESIEWQRVHDLPDFVYFNHSIHVSKGVGCATCHGRIDQMPLTWQVQSLQMRWCLECHRHPEKFVRPREEVFNMNWAPPKDQTALGKELVEKYQIKSLTSCSTCHR